MSYAIKPNKLKSTGIVTSITRSVKLSEIYCKRCFHLMSWDHKCFNPCCPGKKVIGLNDLKKIY